MLGNIFLTKISFSFLSATNKR